MKLSNMLAQGVRLPGKISPPRHGHLSPASSASLAWVGRCRQFRHHAGVVVDLGYVAGDARVLVSCRFTALDIVETIAAMRRIVRRCRR